MLESSDTEKNKIATALQLLHTSAIGATVIDLAVQNPNTGLRIFQSNPPLPGISQAHDSSELNVVGVNPADIDQLHSFNAAGTFGQEQLALILFHEMDHATLPLQISSMQTVLRYLTRPKLSLISQASTTTDLLRHEGR